MRNGIKFVSFFSFAAALLVGVGCHHDSSDPIPEPAPIVSGQYDLVETLTSLDNCDLGSPIAVPISVDQDRPIRL